MDLKNILFFVLGLVVGWNFLPQPEFVKNAVNSVVVFLKKLVN